MRRTSDPERKAALLGALEGAPGLTADRIAELAALALDPSPEVQSAALDVLAYEDVRSGAELPVLLHLLHGPDPGLAQRARTLLLPSERWPGFSHDP